MRTETQLDWPALIEKALTLPGSVGDTYNRFYTYSFLNCVHLMMQGCFEPVATYERWKNLGRQVEKGSKAFEIVRPISVKRETDDGEEVRLTRFKPVRCLFGYSQTKGDPLPPAPDLPGWDIETALTRLDITRKPFTAMDGNVQGYSWERNIAINPVAKYPMKTTLHELGHVVLGHTAAGRNEEYRLHRGAHEFQAESAAYLAGNELGLIDEAQATVSRGYIQGWMQGGRPSDVAIRQVFGATDKILKAGRMAIGGEA